MAPAPEALLQISSQISRPRLESMVAVVPIPSSGPAAAITEGNDGPWQLVGGRKRVRPVERRPQTTFHFRELLFKKAKGKCFKCLSPYHRVASCRNLACCLLCGDFGHKARWCKGEKGEKERAQSGVPLAATSSATAAPATGLSQAPAPSAGAWKKKVGGMEAPARYPEDRPALVRAAAPRSAAIADEERRLTRLGVVAVIVGWCPDLELPDVARAFARNFRVLEDAVKVSLLAPSEFLVVFDNVTARNAAVQWQGAVPFGRVSFMVSPWSRFRKARAGRLSYKVRVCIEGVPPSAHNWEAVRGLFDSTVIFDSVDNSLNSKEDSACFKVWVWMVDVGSLAWRGKLDLEEPLEVYSPLVHFPALGIEADRPERSGPVKTLTYDVLLHLDHVLDYSVSPSSCTDSHVSLHSDIGGMPAGSSWTPECPTHCVRIFNQQLVPNLAGDVSSPSSASRRDLRQAPPRQPLISPTAFFDLNCIPPEEEKDQNHQAGAYPTLLQIFKAVPISHH
ncbi:hypothetical protein ACQ4PT_032541 [Festuca glaucescens]